MKKSPNTFGPIDNWTSKIDPSKATRHANISDALSKSRTNIVHGLLASWLYESGIPFNAVDNDGFSRYCEGLGQFGPGYEPPFDINWQNLCWRRRLRRLMKLLRSKRKNGLKVDAQLWIYVWSDRKRRSIINLCVNSCILFINNNFTAKNNMYYWLHMTYPPWSR